MYRLIALIASLVACGLSSVAIAQPSLSPVVDLSTQAVNSAGLTISLSSDGTRATAVWREPSSNGKNLVKSIRYCRWGGRIVGASNHALLRR
jgi:hypothetical protein